MSFDKFNQLEAAVNDYGRKVEHLGKDDPMTKISHLMCMELIRDLKAERDAPSKYPGLVVRIDHNGKHIAVSLSQEALVNGLDPVALACDSIRGAIAEVLRP